MTTPYDRFMQAMVYNGLNQQILPYSHPQNQSALSLPFVPYQPLQTANGLNSYPYMQQNNMPQQNSSVMHYFAPLPNPANMTPHFANTVAYEPTVHVPTANTMPVTALPDARATPTPEAGFHHSSADALTAEITSLSSHATVTAMRGKLKQLNATLKARAHDLNISNAATSSTMLPATNSNSGPTSSAQVPPVPHGRGRSGRGRGGRGGRGSANSAQRVAASVTQVTHHPEPTTTASTVSTTSPNSHLDMQQDPSISLFEIVADFRSYTHASILHLLRTTGHPLVQALLKKLLKLYLSPSFLNLVIYLDASTTKEECESLVQLLRLSSPDCRFQPAPRAIGESLASLLYRQRNQRDSVVPTVNQSISSIPTSSPSVTISSVSPLSTSIQAPTTSQTMETARIASLEATLQKTVHDLEGAQATIQLMFKTMLAHRPNSLPSTSEQPITRVIDLNQQNPITEPSTNAPNQVNLTAQQQFPQAQPKAAVVSKLAPSSIPVIVSTPALSNDGSPTYSSKFVPLTTYYGFPDPSAFRPNIALANDDHDMDLPMSPPYSIPTLWNTPLANPPVIVVQSTSAPLSNQSLEHSSTSVASTANAPNLIIH